jgi:hypothetical protein
MAVATGACGGSDATFEMNCYDFMNSTSAIQNTSDSARNRQNYAYCQRHPDNMDHALTWDKPAN